MTLSLYKIEFMFTSLIILLTLYKVSQTDKTAALLL